MTQPVFITSINFLTIFEISNSFWKSIITYKWDTHTHQRTYWFLVTDTKPNTGPPSFNSIVYSTEKFMCTIKMLTRLSVLTKADLSVHCWPGWPEYLDSQRLTPVTYSQDRHQLHIASGWQRFLETKDLSTQTHSSNSQILASSAGASFR